MEIEKGAHVRNVANDDRTWYGTVLQVGGRIPEGLRVVGGYMPGEDILGRVLVRWAVQYGETGIEVVHPGDLEVV